MKFVDRWHCIKLVYQLSSHHREKRNVKESISPLITILSSQILKNIHLLMPKNIFSKSLIVPNSLGAFGVSHQDLTFYIIIWCTLSLYGLRPGKPGKLSECLNTSMRTLKSDQLDINLSAALESVLA